LTPALRLSDRTARALALGVIAVLSTACSAGSASPAVTTAPRPPVAPTQTFPGPAGLVGGAQPQPNGYMWLLARTTTGANLQLLNLTTGKVTQVVPASADSVAVSQSPSGLVGVGLASGKTGALELCNGSSGVPVATVPVSAPVKGVYAGADGTTFYVLNGTTAAVSVTLVNSQTDKASISVPVPLDTVAVVVDPAGQNVFALESDGNLDQIDIGSGTVTASFKVGSNPVQLAISSTGTTLYVLKSIADGADIGVVDIATESQTRALPAPADSVGIQPSSDGESLYLVVGTASIGNIQVFSVSS
jgi:DNA-binding beta-propeller fold protein YncE